MTIEAEKFSDLQAGDSVEPMVSILDWGPGKMKWDVPAQGVRKKKGGWIPPSSTFYSNSGHQWMDNAHSQWGEKSIPLTHSPRHPQE